MILKSSHYVLFYLFYCTVFLQPVLSYLNTDGNDDAVPMQHNLSELSFPPDCFLFYCRLSANMNRLSQHWKSKETMKHIRKEIYLIKSSKFATDTLMEIVSEFGQIVKHEIAQTVILTLAETTSNILGRVTVRNFVYLLDYYKVLKVRPGLLKALNRVIREWVNIFEDPLGKPLLLTLLNVEMKQIDNHKETEGIKNEPLEEGNAQQVPENIEFGGTGMIQKSIINRVPHKEETGTKFEKDLSAEGQSNVLFENKEDQLPNIPNTKRENSDVGEENQLSWKNNSMDAEKYEISNSGIDSPTLSMSASLNDSIHHPEIVLLKDEKESGKSAEETKFINDDLPHKQFGSEGKLVTDEIQIGVDFDRTRDLHQSGVTWTKSASEDDPSKDTDYKPIIDPVSITSEGEISNLINAEGSYKDKNIKQNISATVASNENSTTIANIFQEDDRSYGEKHTSKTSEIINGSTNIVAINEKLVDFEEGSILRKVKRHVEKNVIAKEGKDAPYAEIQKEIIFEDGNDDSVPLEAMPNSNRELIKYDHQEEGTTIQTCSTEEFLIMDSKVQGQIIRDSKEELKKHCLKETVTNEADEVSTFEVMKLEPENKNKNMNENIQLSASDNINKLIYESREHNDTTNHVAKNAEVKYENDPTKISVTEHLQENVSPEVHKMPPDEANIFNDKDDTENESEYSDISDLKNSEDKLVGTSYNVEYTDVEEKYENGHSDLTLTNIREPLTDKSEKTPEITLLRNKDIITSYEAITGKKDKGPRDVNTSDLNYNVSSISPSNVKRINKTVKRELEAEEGTFKNASKVETSNATKEKAHQKLKDAEDVSTTSDFSTGEMDKEHFAAENLKASTELVMQSEKRAYSNYNIMSRSNPGSVPDIAVNEKLFKVSVKPKKQTEVTEKLGFDIDNNCDERNTPKTLKQESSNGSEMENVTTMSQETMKFLEQNNIQANKDRAIPQIIQSSDGSTREVLNDISVEGKAEFHSGLEQYVAIDEKEISSSIEKLDSGGTENLFKDSIPHGTQQISSNKIHNIMSTSNPANVEPQTLDDKEVDDRKISKVVENLETMQEIPDFAAIFDDEFGALGTEMDEEELDSESEYEQEVQRNDETTNPGQPNEEDEDDSGIEDNNDIHSTEADQIDEESEETENTITNTKFILDEENIEVRDHSENASTQATKIKNEYNLKNNDEVATLNEGNGEQESGQVDILTPSMEDTPTVPPSSTLPTDSDHKYWPTSTSDNISLQEKLSEETRTNASDIYENISEAVPLYENNGDPLGRQIPEETVPETNENTIENVRDDIHWDIVNYRDNEGTSSTQQIDMIKRLQEQQIAEGVAPETSTNDHVENTMSITNSDLNNVSETLLTISDSDHKITTNSGTSTAVAEENLKEVNAEIPVSRQLQKGEKTESLKLESQFQNGDVSKIENWQNVEHIHSSVERSSSNDFKADVKAYNNLNTEHNENLTIDEKKDSGGLEKNIKVESELCKVPNFGNSLEINNLEETNKNTEIEDYNNYVYRQQNLGNLEAEGKEDMSRMQDSFEKIALDKQTQVEGKTKNEEGNMKTENDSMQSISSVVAESKDESIKWNADSMDNKSSEIEKWKSKVENIEHAPSDKRNEKHTFVPEEEIMLDNSVQHLRTDVIKMEKKDEETTKDLEEGTCTIGGHETGTQIEDDLILQKTAETEVENVKVNSKPNDEGNNKAVYISPDHAVEKEKNRIDYDDEKKYQSNYERGIETQEDKNARKHEGQPSSTLENSVSQQKEKFSIKKFLRLKS